MPCQTVTNAKPQQPTAIIPQSLPQSNADWARFIQVLNQYVKAGTQTGVNYIPTQYAVYDGTAIPALRITGA